MWSKSGQWRRNLPTLVLLAFAAIACDPGGDSGFPAELDLGELDKGMAPPAKPLEDACSVLTAEAASHLLGLAGSSGVKLSDDVGDMCIYAATDGSNAEVVFELMFPFGKQLYAIQEGEAHGSKALKGVGEEAFTTAEGDASVLDSYQGNVFLRLKVSGVRDAQLSERMKVFAQAALAGY